MPAVTRARKSRGKALPAGHRSVDTVPAPGYFLRDRTRPHSDSAVQERASPVRTRLLKRGNRKNQARTEPAARRQSVHSEAVLPSTEQTKAKRNNDDPDNPCCLSWKNADTEASFSCRIGAQAASSQLDVDLAKGTLQASVHAPTASLSASNKRGEEKRKKKKAMTTTTK